MLARSESESRREEGVRRMRRHLWHIGSVVCNRSTCLGFHLSTRNMKVRSQSQQMVGYAVHDGTRTRNPCSRCPGLDPDPDARACFRFRRISLCQNFGGGQSLGSSYLSAASTCERRVQSLPRADEQRAWDAARRVKAEKIVEGVHACCSLTLNSASSSSSRSDALRRLLTIVLTSS